MYGQSFYRKKIKFKADVLESRAPESKTAMILNDLGHDTKIPLFFQILISQNKYPLIGL